MKALARLRSGRVLWLVFALVAVLLAGFTWRTVRQTGLDRALVEAIRRNDAAAVRVLPQRRTSILLDYAERPAAEIHIGSDILTLLQQAAAKRSRTQPHVPGPR